MDNFKVECSFNSLKYVVINLIKNSCAHSGYNIKIEVRAENNELYFKDYGREIKKEIIEKIPYFPNFNSFKYLNNFHCVFVPFLTDRT